MKNKLSLLVLILLASFSVVHAQKKGHKIVFQLATDAEKEHGSLTRQLNNVLNYWPDAKIVVVVHSAALEFMMNEKSTVKPAVEELMAKGVTFAVCQNTMKRKQVTEDQIIKGAIFVPVGIAELVIKQEQNYKYIKAGY
jgi:uncharacterized protein